MSNQKYPAAKQKAEYLIETYGMNMPVKVFELAELLGLRWKTCSSEEMKKYVTKVDTNMKPKELGMRLYDILGLYDKSSNFFYIHTNNQPITRMRFTMAHEIGHSQLHSHLEQNHHYRQIIYRQDLITPQDTSEVEANYFAGYLLMPDKEITQLLPYTSIMLGGEQIIQKFAKIFAVSSEAMRIRFKTYKSEYPQEWDSHNLSSKLF